MKVPPISIQEPDIENDINTIIEFALPGTSSVWDWSTVIWQRYPLLAKQVAKVATNKGKQKVIREYLRVFYTKNKEHIIQRQKEITRLWEPIHTQFLTTLAAVLETPWSTNKTITAEVSLNPICPIDVQKWFFYVSYFKSDTDILETFAHEITHFLYYKKWFEVFPKDAALSLEPPHVFWHLSEILVSIILNDPRLNALLNLKATSYDVYYRTKINDQSVMVVLSNLYERNSGRNFGAFLSKARKLVLQHNEVISEAQ